MVILTSVVGLGKVGLLEALGDNGGQTLQDPPPL